MPTISSFLGIVIRMYYREHSPPHFHAVYGSQDVAVSIETLEVLEGRLTRRALNLVLDWAEIHRSELLENWRLVEEHKPLKDICPLE
jgi:hypothetical protein